MIAKVQLWGRTIGAVSLEAGRDVATLKQRGRTATIIEQVLSAVRRWPELAAAAQLAGEWRDKIQNAHRLTFPEK